MATGIPRKERIYKGFKITETADPEKTFIKIDSTDFKRPQAISASGLGKMIVGDLDADLDSKNVSAVEFAGQDGEPNKEPSEIPLAQSINIAIDENYLYIWVPKLKKWKRILLSDWPDADLPDPDQP
jgi:hypothetical protein